MKGGILMTNKERFNVRIGAIVSTRNTHIPREDWTKYKVIGVHRHSEKTSYFEMENLETGERIIMGHTCIHIIENGPKAIKVKPRKVK